MQEQNRDYLIKYKHCIEIIVNSFTSMIKNMLLEHIIAYRLVNKSVQIVLYIA